MEMTNQLVTINLQEYIDRFQIFNEKADDVLEKKFQVKHCPLGNYKKFRL